MSDKDLIKALRGIAVKTGSLVCQGCGHEHDCREHGCAIIFKAAARLQASDREGAEAVHCKDCKYLYFKDFWMFCPHRAGPCRPEGFCERGVRRED